MVGVDSTEKLIHNIEMIQQQLYTWFEGIGKRAKIAVTVVVCVVVITTVTMLVWMIYREVK